MNYDKKYDIRFATVADIADIMKFIDTYVKKGHILARDEALFRYEHVEDDVVRFVIAVEKETGILAGILGYIPASHDNDMLDIWTGIWQVKDHVIPFLGLELYMRLQGMVGARALLGVGDDPDTTGVLLKKKTREFNSWKMKHYYMLADKEEFLVARISHVPEGPVEDDTVVTDTEELLDIEQVKSFIDLSSYTGYPHKDLWYVNHRYFEHPVYRYRVYGLELDGKRALMCLRLQALGQERVVRIVDYIGDRVCMSGMRGFFKDYLDMTGAEYADLYECGFEDDYLTKAGLTECGPDDDNIIPEYFYPFVRKNIDIWVSGNIPEGLFMKADGDMDRPN